jgi:FkbM family methyltransferase
LTPRLIKIAPRIAGALRAALAKARPSRLLEEAIVLYGTRCPIDRGKWRIIQTYINSVLSRNADGRPRGLVRRNGFLFNLDLENYVDQWVYLTGFYEKDDYLEALHAVGPRQGGVAFDVGAHMGLYTLGLSRAVGASGQIHSFEPNPDSFKRLAEHVSTNRCTNVTLNRTAVGEHRGQKTLLAPKYFNTGGATLLQMQLPSSWKAQSMEVQVISLDEYCSKMEIRRLDFMKIDVQGYEPFVLLGAESAIRSFRPRILIECDSRFLGQAGWSTERLFHLLKTFHYELFQLGRRKMVKITSPVSCDFTTNLHCIPM